MKEDLKYFLEYLWDFITDTPNWEQAKMYLMKNGYDDSEIDRLVAEMNQLLGIENDEE